MSAAHAAIMGRAATLDSRIAALAGVQPIITGALNINQAWVRGSPCAVAAIPGWGFTRALAAYGERPDLTLEPFASGAPRLVNGRGQLIEGARTNLCLRSQEFDNASWTKASCTATANAATAPDGTLTADKLIVDNAVGLGSFVGALQSFSKAASGIQYTYSIMVSAAGLNRVAIRAQDSGGIANSAGVTLSLVDGSITTAAAAQGTFSGASAIVRALASGFYLVSLTFTSSTDTFLRIYVLPQDSSITTGDGVKGIYPWGVQLEAAAFPSSYIPTTTTSVTRPADIPLIDISAYSPAITYPLTMYARFERVVDTGGAEVFLCISSDGTNTDRATLQVASDDVFQCDIHAGGVQQAALRPAGALSIGVAYKGAFRIASNDAIAARSGILSAQDTSVTVPAAPGRITLSARPDGAIPSFGYLSEFAIIPGAVSDANLVRLTA